MAISQRPLTLEEFLRLPEEKPALEFERREGDPESVAEIIARQTADRYGPQL